MQGFKSFADPVCIELNDGITCIVGPNGSGKSNISDALRWVLGEQSPKQLRGNRMDEVIFAGTANRRPKGMAEVSLVIDNSGGELPVDYNEVEVTRRMFRSGESEYMINGNNCRLKDIRELFMDTGIGVDGYSIIGQGKIQEIVSIKPENRREIFEEAAGIVFYKNRKQDADRKLTAAEDNLERVRDIIAEIEGRIDGLKEDSEKAQEYIELRDRYRMLAVNIILHSIDNLEKNVEGGRLELEELTELHQSVLAKNEALEAAAEACRVKDADLNEQYEKCNQLLRSKTEELHQITNRGQINTERLNNIENDLHRLQTVLSDTLERLTAAKANRSELEQSANTMDAERKQLRSGLDDAVFRLNEQTRKNSAVLEQIERNKESVIDLSNKNVSRNAEIRTLENYRNTLEERMTQLSQESEGRDETAMQNRERLKEIQVAFDRKCEEKNAVQSEIRRLNDKILENNRLVSDSSKRIEESMLQVNRLTTRRNTIEEMESNYEGYNNAVRQVMQRNFRGIVGPVSEQMTVPDGYELAIETALGGAMQNIICENDNSAKQAVEWLKSARAGRATFLPIASIHGGRPYEGTAQRMTGFLGTASEMIECKPSHREIYNYLLGRVLIADNMTHAIAISKEVPKGYRIVTVEGEVVSASGAITGGRYRNKSANLLERRKEITTLGEEISKLKASQEQETESRNRLEKELETYRASLDGKNQHIQKIEIELSVLRSEKEHTEELVAASNNASSHYEEELQNIREDVKRAEDMIVRYREQITEAEEQIRRMEEEAETLSKDSEHYRSATEEHQEKVVSFKVQLGEQDQKILAMNENIERVIDEIADLEDAYTTAEEEHEEQNKQRLLLTSSGAQSDEKEVILRGEKTALEEEVSRLTAELDQNRTEQAKVLGEKKGIAQEVQDVQDRKYKLEIKNTKNETLLTSQKDKLWDEFEMSYAEAKTLRDADFSITSGNREVHEIKLRMAEIGDVNISAIEEYQSVRRRYEFMMTQAEDLTKAMEELQSIIRNMDRTIKERFRTNFNQIEVYFEEIFHELFGGGHAELRLEDEENPLESGVDIIAQPPGKALKNINLMSGGEKTMTAIALMFAVLKTKPTPFCILDEVEAALDEANIERFAKYLRHFHEIQFAIITHQKVTMEYADVLYGVTMPEHGISKMLSLKLEDAREMDLE